MRAWGCGCDVAGVAMQCDQEEKLGIPTQREGQSPNCREILQMGLVNGTQNPVAVCGLVGCGGSGWFVFGCAPDATRFQAGMGWLKIAIFG